MERRIGLYALIVMVFMLAFGAGRMSAAQRGEAMKWRPAQTHEEFIMLMKMDPRQTPDLVRNMDDWKASFERLGRAHPLARFQQERVEKFTASLTFGERGLSGAHYGDLGRPLVDLFDVLELFGIGNELSADYDDMGCSGRATCSPLLGSVCIGANC